LPRTSPEKFFRISQGECAKIVGENFGTSNESGYN
jgi:hypothetical protein